jgi:glucosylceramidase
MTKAAPPGALQWVLSARDLRHGQELRLATQPPLLPAGGPGASAAEHARAHTSAPARLWVDSSRRFQQVLGFGGAFTEAAATTWLKLSPPQREALLRAYFHPTQGHGYTLCRVHMNSCDFALGNYAHVEREGDFTLDSFNIERDRQALLPMIHAAQAMAGRPLKLLASPWSPPAWMKDSGRMNDGGKLKPECRAAWAQCYVRFIRAYEAEGVPIWGVSVQNEPEARQRWDSCIYSAEEERDFVRDHLGPALHAAGLEHVRIVVWDHNRDAMVERASVIYGDPEAAKYIWGTGFHWYMEDHFEHVQLVHDAWPDKQLLFTEGCQEGGPHWGRWELAERYARSILNDLNHWTVGWIDWNLLLDEQGGPNHVGNFCSAPFLAVPDEDGLHAQSSFAALGHFARYVQPGAQRVLAAATKEALECSAFANPDGSLAVVVLNRSEHDIAFSLAIDGVSHAADLPAHAIATYTTPSR